MGGRRGKHRLSNLVWLESELNWRIEGDARLRRESVERGITVSGFEDPALVPVVHAVHGLVWLTDDGRAVPVGDEVPF